MELDPNDVKALIGILQRLVSGDKNSAQTSVQQPIQEDTDNKIHNAKPKPANKLKTRKTQIQHTNTFMDMPEMNMHKEDSLVDKKLQKFPPTPRRRPLTMVEVKCRVCGKEEVVSAKILPESSNRYKCNECSRSGG